MTPLGIPETYQLHINNLGDQGEGTITIATGVWTIPGPINIPQQLVDSISKTIEDFYNKKNNQALKISCSH